MNHFIEALEKSLYSKNWYSVLFISLTLPDICGKIEYPELESSKKRSVQWFDKYLGPIYKSEIGGKEYILLGNSDFYALRCALLHEGQSDISSQGAHDVLENFKFVQPTTENIYIHRNKINRTLQLQVDQFGLEVLQATRQWLREIGKDDSKFQKLDSMLEIQILDPSQGFSF